MSTPFRTRESSEPEKRKPKRVKLSELRTAGHVYGLRKEPGTMSGRSSYGFGTLF